MTYAAAAALILGVVARFAVLEADPAFDWWPWYVVIVDEGRWADPARNLALFGELNLDNVLVSVHLLVAPLYQAASAVAFALFGVGLGSARLVSAASGALLLTSAFFFLRNRVAPSALAISVVILGFQADLLTFSRIAIPEMSALLFGFLGFALLVSAPHTAARAFCGGLVIAVALGFKGTVFPIVLIFGVVVFVVHAAGDRRDRVRRVGAFIGGVAAPFLLSIGVLLFALGGLSARLESTVPTVLGFLVLADAYEAATLLFYGPLAPALNSLLVVNLGIAGMMLAVGYLPQRGRDLYLGSAVWAGGWITVPMVLGYFPPRYLIHAIVPLTINIAAGLTLLREVGWRDLVERLDTLRPARRSLVAALLAFPLATLLATPLISMAGLFGITMDRFREHVPLLAFLEVAIATVAFVSWRGQRVIVGLVALPLFILALRGAWNLIDPNELLLWRSSGPVGVARWGILMACAALITGALSSFRGSLRAVRTAGLAYATVAICGWLTTVGPTLLSPTFTMMSASRALGQVIPEGTVVGSFHASSLFLDNELRYYELGSTDVDSWGLPEIVVVGFTYVDLEPQLVELYQPIHTSELNYGKDFSRFGGVSPEITVWRRVP